MNARRLQEWMSECTAPGAAPAWCQQSNCHCHCHPQQTQLQLMMQGVPGRPVDKNDSCDWQVTRRHTDATFVGKL